MNPLTYEECPHYPKQNQRPLEASIVVDGTVFHLSAAICEGCGALNMPALGYIRADSMYDREDLRKHSNEYLLDSVLAALAVRARALEKLDEMKRDRDEWKAVAEKRKLDYEDIAQRRSQNETVLAAENRCWSSRHG
jgi:hypothetical protein